MAADLYPLAVPCACFAEFFLDELKPGDGLERPGCQWLAGLEGFVELAPDLCPAV